MDFHSFECDFAGAGSLKRGEVQRRPYHDARTVRGQGDEELSSIIQGSTGHEDLARSAAVTQGMAPSNRKEPGEVSTAAGTQPARRCQVRDADGRECRGRQQSRLPSALR